MTSSPVALLTVYDTARRSPRWTGFTSTIQRFVGSM
jgi:hypothetical protein